ncbi:hypothetical protein [Paraburkholderia atlantica]|uniref:hypothetical protein n=1 Tax=Paraburkholderia atlantica TaxID=2654982 RepID=UPI001612A6A0|nr:hypothetical protein [Paraburkholderia atlantica]MBB5508105.1 hypothetical protein [Paraburkholderia atlantica]
MSDYALALRRLTNDDILALLDRKGHELERLERAYRTGWYEGEAERDQVKGQYNDLILEWDRRNSNQGEAKCN